MTSTREEPCFDVAGFPVDHAGAERVSPLEDTANSYGTAASRVLKVEADGDHWHGTIMPKIRLKGRWLERAGFKPGTHVQVRQIAAGILEMRSEDSALILNETPDQGC